MTLWIIVLLVHAALLLCQSDALGMEPRLPSTIKTLGVRAENISKDLDSLATDPQQSVRLLVAELHPIRRKTYFESKKTKECRHVIACLRALHYLAGFTFSSPSAETLTDDEKQFLDFRIRMHDENPGHALHFFGVWMSRNADIVAPADAQRNIIKQWHHWVTESGNSFNSAHSGTAAESMDEWFWFG